MKTGRSTGKPTKEESERIVAAKEGICIPCLSWFIAGNMHYSQVAIGGDYDHKKSGNVRRGHMSGFCSCAWHHRRIPGDWSFKAIRDLYGPSLMDGSRLFREAYGTDDELIALQTMVIERGVTAAIEWKRDRV